MEDKVLTIFLPPSLVKYFSVSLINPKKVKLSCWNPWKRDLLTYSERKLLEIPRGPRGIDFVFLDPRGMLNCHSSIPRGVKFSEELPSRPGILTLCPVLSKASLQEKRKKEKKLQFLKIIFFKTIFDFFWFFFCQCDFVPGRPGTEEFVRNHCLWKNSMFCQSDD